MKTRTALLSVGCFAMVCACGGSDTNIPDASGNDTGTADTGTGMDGSGNQDTGTDTGSGMDSGSDAGNLNVAAVPCVVLWLDAAHSVTQVANIVSAWGDQTSNANNATQAIALRQPMLVANGINGLPTIHFAKGQAGTGNMLNITDKVSLQFGTADFGVWVVSRFDNNPADGNTTGVGVLYSKQGASNNNAGPLLWANNDIAQTVAGLKGGTNGNAVVGFASTYNDNKARAYGVRRTGNMLELRVNGAQVAMVMQNGAVDVTNNGNARIGADGDASIHRLNGDVSEVVACKGTMAANDLTALDAYFKAKYNL